MDELLQQKIAEDYWIRKTCDHAGLPIKSYIPDHCEKGLGKYVLPLDAQLCAGLQQVSQGKDLNLFIFFAASLHLLLQRYTGDEDTLLVTPCPRLDDKENGNPLFLRASTKPADTVRDFLSALQEELKEAYKHREYSFPKFFEKYNRLGNGGELFQCSFSYNALSAENEYLDKAPLLFEIEKTAGEGFTLNLRYDQSRYDLFFASQLVGHYKRLISLILEKGSSQRIDEMELLSEGDRELLHTFNNTEVKFETETVLRLFERQAKLNPDHPAVFFRDKSLSYSDLERQAEQVACCLLEKGIQPGDIVSVIMERSEKSVISILGILKAGAAYLPVDPDNPIDRVRYMLEDCQCRIALLNSDYLAENTQLLDQFEIINIDALPAFSQPVEEFPSVDMESPAYLIYTSGSTGNPKGVVIPHRALANFIRAFGLAYNDRFSPADRCLSLTNMAFDVSVCELFIALTNGSTLVMLEKEAVYSPEKIAGCIIQREISFAYIPPVLLKDVQKALAAEQGSIQLNKLLVGVEPIRDEVLHSYAQLKPGMQIINGYGPTEATVSCTLYTYKAEAPEGKVIPIGKPIANTRVYILDQSDRLQPVGVAGELCISGSGLALGYLNQAFLDDEKFVPDPFAWGEKMYRTGDLARWMPDGNIGYIGRKDNQLKIRGYRVEPNEVQACLLKHPGIREAIVLGNESQEGDKYLCAYLVFSSEEIGFDDLRGKLLKELPEYMVPEAFVKLDYLPFTSNGKIDRKKLPMPSKQRVSGKPFEAPVTKTEKALAGIWSEVLGIEKISLEDHFFELGGHSLKAAKVAASIHRDLAVEVPLRQLFKHTTIRSLAAFIDGKSETAPAVEIQPAALAEYYPVSYAQRRLYLNKLFDQDTVTYNMPSAFILQGNLDKAAFERAFEMLIERHESLRTVFKTEEDGAVQVIREKVPFRVEYLEQGQHRTEEHIRSFVRPFDLSEGPLLRVSLLELEGGKQVLLFDMHHIISDGVSMEIIVSEFARLYNGETLAPLKLQYKDYSTWQHAFRQSDSFREQEKYWLKQFETLPEALGLPTDYKRDAEQNFEGDSYPFTISGETEAALRKLARESDVSLYMLTLAVYNIVLSKYGGQEDLVVGTPVSGRQHPDLEQLIGMFVNTLPLRSIPQGNKTVNMFLAEIRETFFQAFENQDYPFEELVDKLGLERIPGKNPLFDTMFLYQTVSASPQLEGLDLKPYELANKAAKFDLALEISEQEQGLFCIIDYASRLFSRQTIARFALHFQQALEDVALHPGKKIKEINLLPQEEKTMLLKRFNATENAFPKECIHTLFSGQAQKTPDHVAVLTEQSTLSYKELERQAAEFASVLVARGLKHGEPVAVLLEKSEKLVIALLAILKAGGVYLPVDHEYPEERIRYMLSDSACRYAICDENLSERNAALLAGNQLLIAIDESIEKIPVKFPEICSNDPAYLIYTSGSTGQPKGVLVSHGSFVNMILAQIKGFGVEMQDRCLLFASPAFDASLSEIFMGLLAGAALVPVDKAGISDVNRLKQRIKKLGVSVATIPPSYLAVTEAEVLRPIRILITAGEAIHAEVARHFSKGRRFFNAYGPTEASVCVSYHEIDSENYTQIPIGKPISNTRLYVLDKNMELQPLGVPGELYIAGEGLALRYLNQAELTAEKFIENPYRPGEKLYRSGDLAKWLPDGNLLFLGRADQQVKIRGYRVEIEEIENVFLSFGPIREAVVLAREDKQGDKFLVAYYVAGQEFKEEELNAHLAKKLPAYMLPSYCVRLNAIPLTPNGKADRKKLPDPAFGSQKRTETRVPPANSVEERLLTIWGDVLQSGPMGVTDNFLDAGGQSLKAMVLVARIQKEFEAEISIRDVFKYPTVRSMAAYLVNALGREFAPIVPVAGRASYDLSSAQKRIFVMSRFKGAETSYNMPGILRIEGQIEVRRLEKAFVKLVRRHEILRTSFEMLENEPVQIVHEAVVFQMPVKSCAEKEVRRHVNEFIRGFDLTQAPLLRVELLQTPEGNILMYDMHHIVGDGVSMKIFVQEVLALYREQELPELKLQYKDFAVWQKAFFQSGAIGPQKNFWKKQFTGELPVLNLPYDFPRPAAQSFEGKNYAFSFAPGKSAQVFELARRTGTTVNMLLMAAYNILLSKYCGQHDIIIGTPVAGRSHADLEPLIGMFVNTIALRAYPEPKKSFADFLVEVRLNTLQAYENQDYPFEELVETLAVKRDLSRNPLFDTLFIFMQKEENGDQADGLQFKPYAFESGIAKFDLTFEAIQSSGQLEFLVNYATSLFVEDSIKNLADRFEFLIDQILANPKIELNKISLLSGTEKLLLEEFNPECVLPETESLPDAWKKQVKNYPEQAALICKNNSLSYRELDEKSDRLAQELVQYFGIREEDRVGLMLSRSEWLPVSLLAILKAGAAYVPIDPAFPEKRISYMLEDSGCSLLISDHDCNFQLKQLNVNSLGLFTDAECKLPSASADKLAYVSYTSGSTGQPKGVMLEHRNVVSFNLNLSGRFGISRGDRILALTNLSFDISALELLCSLISGVQITLATEEEAVNPSKIQELIRENKINVLQLTPSRLKLLVDSLGTAFLNGVQTLLVGGEALPASLAKILQQLENTRVFNVYGPTESCIWSTAFELVPGRISIGSPLIGEQAYVLNDHNSLQPLGIAGEICIGGAGLARGYMNKPEVTAEKFVGLPEISAGILYRTGDLGRWLPDGTLEFMGRKDQQLKIRGYRVEAGEIENVLGAHPNIRAAAVITKEIQDQPELFAFYESTALISASELKTYLSGYLPAYMVPAHLVQLDNIPLTASGKTDRKALEQLQAGPAFATRAMELPAGETELQLAEIWKNILDIEIIGANDNFFESGGNSIKLIQMLSRVHQVLGIEIPMMEAFRLPTIRELTGYISLSDTISAVHSESPYLAFNPGQKQSLFFFPPAVGYSFVYDPLARELGQYSIYGFHFIEEEDRIRQYVAQILEIQPEGPYILGGYSVGGNLAFEVAHEMERQQLEVSGLFLLDAYKRVKHHPETETLIGQNTAAYLEGIDNRFSAFGQEYLAGLKARAAAKINAYERYFSGKWDEGVLQADIYQLKCSEDLDNAARTRSWGTLTTGNFYELEGEGNHPEMLISPFLEKNAALMAEALQELTEKQLKNIKLTY